MRNLNFQIIILLSSFVITTIIALIIIPILRKLKIGQIERIDGPKSHLKKQGTPTMGGIIILIGITIITGVLAFYYYKQENTEFVIKIIPLFIATVRIWISWVC